MTPQQIEFVKKYFGCWTGETLTSLGTVSIVSKEELAQSFGNEVDRYFTINHISNSKEVTIFIKNDAIKLIEEEANLHFKN